MDLILFARDDANHKVAALDLALELRDKALGQSALVGKVTNASDNEKAVAAQLSLKDYLDTVEQSRVFVKAPVLEFGSKIDALAKQLKAEALDEMFRLAKIVGTFQEQEKAKARAAEALRLRDLEEIERKRQAELAQAQSVDHADAIQLKYDRIEQSVPVVQSVRATNQVVKEDWEITITNALALANGHPQCVNIEPRLRDIKVLLDAGVKVAGVRAIKVTIGGVRMPKGKMIEA